MFGSGVLWGERTHMDRASLVGQKFNRWLVCGAAARNEYVVCRCACGTEKEVKATHLLRGNTRSCGCYRREASSEKARTHGYSRTPEYYAWWDMRARCYDERDNQYHNYGARGISVCDRWRSSFANFIADMGPRPAGYSIERDDVNGNYEPGNCRWIPRSQQADNRRNTVWLRHEGRLVSLTKASAQAGLKPSVVRDRIFRYGWSVGRALSEPVAPTSKRVAR